MFEIQRNGIEHILFSYSVNGPLTTSACFIGFLSRPAGAVRLFWEHWERTFCCETWGVSATRREVGTPQIGARGSLRSQKHLHTPVLGGGGSKPHFVLKTNRVRSTLAIGRPSSRTDWLTWFPKIRIVELGIWNFHFLEGRGLSGQCFLFSFKMKKYSNIFILSEENVGCFEIVFKKLEGFLTESPRNEEKSYWKRDFVEIFRLRRAESEI